MVSGISPISCLLRWRNDVRGWESWPFHETNHYTNLKINLTNLGERDFRDFIDKIKLWNLKFWTKEFLFTVGLNILIDKRYEKYWIWEFSAFEIFLRHVYIFIFSEITLFFSSIWFWGNLRTSSSFCFVTSRKHNKKSHRVCPGRY